MADIEQLLRTARREDAFGTLLQFIPYAQFLGAQVERREGRLLTILPFRDMLVGNMRLPALHGGVVGALLESAAMVSLIAEMEVARLPKIINITVEYLRSAGPQTTYADATVTRQGRRVAHVRAQAWQGDAATPVAQASVHFLVR